MTQVDPRSGRGPHCRQAAVDEMLKTSRGTLFVAVRHDGTVP